MFVEPDPRPHPFNQEIMAAGDQWYQTALKQRDRERTISGSRAAAELLNLDPNLFSQLMPEQQKNFMELLGKRETNDQRTNYQDKYLAAKGASTAQATRGANASTFAAEHTHIKGEYDRKLKIDLAHIFKRDQFGELSFDLNNEKNRADFAEWRKINDPPFEEANRELYRRFGMVPPNYFGQSANDQAMQVAPPKATTDTTLRSLQAKAPAQANPNAEYILPGNIRVQSRPNANGQYRWTPIDQNGQVNENLPSQISENKESKLKPQELPVFIRELTKRLPPKEHKGKRAQGKRGEMYESDGSKWVLVDD